MRSLRPLLLGGLLTVAFAVPAFAQTTGSIAPAKSTYPLCPKQPSTEEQNKGHNAYVFGKEKYDNGKLEEAIILFKDAYERDCQNHDYLIIISRAYERQPNLPEAIHALETYVDRAKDAPDLDKHRANLESMRQRLKAAIAAAATAKPQPTTAPTPAPTTPPPPPQEEHSIAPWVVAGAGVVVLATGITLYAVGGSNIPPDCGGKTCVNYLNNGTRNPNNTGISATGATVPCIDPITGNNSTANGCSHSDFNKQRQADAGTYSGMQTAGLITAIGGGVILVGGVVWHFVEPTGPKKEGGLRDFRVAPVVAPGYNGLAMGARF